MEPENKENLESLNKEQPNQIISQGEHELQNNSESKQNIEAESKTEQLNPGTGYGIAALVFGIISIVFLYYIIISVLSAILAIFFSLQKSYTNFLPNFLTRKNIDVDIIQADIIINTVPHSPP